MAMQTVLRPTDHAHPAGEICPYCEQSIPNDRAEEIRAKYERKQRQDEVATKARLDQQVADARKQIEADKKAEVEKLQQDNAAALQKVIDDAVARETVAREQGKKAAEAEAQQRFETMQAAQDASAAKLQELTEQKAAIEQQLAKSKADQETTIAERTAEVRAAFEKSKADDIAAINAKNAETNQRLTEQIQALQRRINADEGEGADIKLVDVLKKKFPKDDIKAIRKSSGADIMHTVMHNKRPCGTIVYDSRNRNSFQSTFASALRADMVAAKAAHAILTTTKFPAGIRHIHLCEGVIVAGLARVAVLAEILREEIVRYHAQRVSQEDRERKTAKLYDFIASDSFDDTLESLFDNDKKLLQLDEDEQKTHKKVWEKRRTLATNSQKLHGKLRTDIDRIIGTAEAD